MADMQNQTNIFLKTIIGLNLDHLNLTISNIVILDQIMILPYNLSNTAYGKTAQSQKIGHKDEPNKICAAVITETIAS